MRRHSASSSSLRAIELCLGLSVGTALDTIQHWYCCLFGDQFCKGFSLVESAFSAANRMEGNGDNGIDRDGRYSLIAHCVQQDFCEQAAQIILASIFEAVNEISEHAFCLVDGDRAIECQYTIFTVRAGEISRDRTFEWPGAAMAKWGIDWEDRIPALVTKEYFWGLGRSACHAVRRIKQLDQRLKQHLSQIGHGER